MNKKMGFKFWVVRALSVFTVVTVILFVVELIKQHSVINALIFATSWSLVATSIFIASRLYQSRKGVACMICNDIPKEKNSEP